MNRPQPIVRLYRDFGSGSGSDMLADSSTEGGAVSVATDRRRRKRVRTNNGTSGANRKVKRVMKARKAIARSEAKSKVQEKEIEKQALYEIEPVTSNELYILQQKLESIGPARTKVENKLLKKLKKAKEIE